eukprot:CAMPEP_0198123678 /NCGR_PEP_ID=MMETSP1442-20131203/38104_1 /TAXON_ID= /ORGANISM="Craspedostauros australis, Strain CCMP3328" /LENGTH=64 /DNA_ID=CAMNT_0043782919 /DNA_START=778 /DNA_END=972 /DNA_ORIENTATION=-
MSCCLRPADAALSTSIMPADVIVRDLTAEKRNGSSTIVMQGGDEDEDRAASAGVRCLAWRKDCC